MQYGTKKPTGDWRMTITVRCEPRCPGCAEFLQSGAVEFRDGWAWCAVCILSKLHSAPWIGVVLGSDSMVECSAVHNGLRFYTPDVVGRESHTAFEHCEKIRERAALTIVEPLDSHVYLVTPAGEAAIGDCDLTPLQVTEAAMKGIQAACRK